jgi:membrane protease YdiL (CAAX protease family)
LKECSLSSSGSPSSDNPQFDVQPPASVEASGHEAAVLDPLAPGPDAAGGVAHFPTAPTPAVENPVWSGWDVLLITVLSAITMLALQFGFVLAEQFLRHTHQTFAEVLQNVGEQPLLLIVLSFLNFIPVALFMFLLVEGKYHSPFWQEIRWNWPRSRWQPLGLGAAMLLALGLLQSLLPMPKDTPFEHLFDRPLDAYLLAILAVSIGPLVEELFFRGFLYPVLARRTGVAWGIVLTALPFGLLHLPQYGWSWGAALIIFLVGVICGIVRAATRSVAASFLVHVGYNGTQMLIAVVMTQGFRHMPKALIF